MLTDYLEKIKKTECEDCPLREINERPIIKIPPPKKPKIMFISLDPTLDFIPLSSSMSSRFYFNTHL